MDDAAVGSLENSFNFQGQAAQLFEFFESQGTFVTARTEVHSLVCLFIRIIILDLEEDL